MKKMAALTLVLILALAVLVPAMAEGAIKRIGTLQMLNMTESEYAAVQKLRARTGVMMNEAGVPAEHPYYDGMLDEEPEIVFFDNLNDMIMALDAGQIDAIDLNRSTAEYLCANNEGLAILMDYEAEDNILADFLFNTFMGYDFSLMLPQEKQDLADELIGALDAIGEEGQDKLAVQYINGAINGDIPSVEMPVIEGAETIRVAVTGDLPPMDYVSPDGQPAGFNVALLAEISSLIGKNIELVPISAEARALALSSGQVDVVFWSRSCVAVQEMIENDLHWMDLLDPEDEEDQAMLERINDELLPDFDYVTYAGKDIPDGLIVTDSYYTDSTVLVVKQ